MNIQRLLASVADPRAYIALFRLVNYYNYDHVTPRRRLTMASGVRLSPTASLRNAERISIGAGSHIGSGNALWAGDRHGTIRIGRGCLFGPDVFLTASNYGTASGRAIMDQPRSEKNITIGDDVWLGARVIVLAGVTIGDGAVVAANSVVTRSVDPGWIVAGVPARPVRQREPECL